MIMIFFWILILVILVKNFMVAYARMEALKMIMSDSSKSSSEQMEIYHSYPSYFEMLMDWTGWNIDTLFPGIILKIGH